MDSAGKWLEPLASSLGIGVEVLLALVIVAGGALVHLLVGALVKHLHRAVSNNEFDWDDVIFTALSQPVRVVVWVVVIFLVSDLFPAAGGLRTLALQAYDTALIVTLAWFIHRLISGSEQELLCEKHGTRKSTDKATVRAVAKLLRVILWVIAGLMILQSLGVSISGLLAFGGIGGIAVGFAAKDLLANFFGGLSIYLDRPFTTGDWIRSPDKSIEGTVEDIGWRLTRIRTFDQRPLYVPNAVFSQISVENPSRMLNRRIYETIGLRYQDSDRIGPVVAQVKEMLQHHPDIDLNKTLIVNFVSFGPSSLDFFVYTFTKTTDWVTFHRIKQDILLKILEIIHANGADVAYPTRTLHVEHETPREQS